MAPKKKLFLKFGLLTAEPRNAIYLDHVLKGWAGRIETIDKPFGEIFKMEYSIPKKFVDEDKESNSRYNYDAGTVTLVIYEFKDKQQLLSNVQVLAALDFMIIVSFLLQANPFFYFITFVFSPFSFFFQMDTLQLNIMTI
ncbi:hypothetical protein RFI_12321 [Reticulomyxa filosa]|uniref:Uncharacterized protein n=1 Tax=Reticulomyxa filosa TaxID=46433 RepID=X6NFU7_RETFI|nr:hypothetical protein RFI_12321 [Reticulomyxa filosa]|eukprot:ETO24836.1 hypothetical protein RFI_12321 [Reticulomyxa filosa]